MGVLKDVDAANGETDGDQQTAGDDKGNHIGHAGHQMFVGAGAGRRLLRLGLLDLGIVVRTAGVGSLHLSLFNSGAHQRRSVMNRGLGAGFVKTLTGKAAFIHLGVSSDNYQIRSGDVLGGQVVFRPHRTLGFHLDGVTLTLRALL